MTEGTVGRHHEEAARLIAEKVGQAWHARFSGGAVGAPVSAVAALTLIRPADPLAPALQQRLLVLDAQSCGRTLRQIWVRFGRVRPDLIPRVRLLCGWLWSDVAAEHLDGVQAVMAAAIRAGLLEFAAGPAGNQTDLLGPVLGVLRGGTSMKARGALYTPPDVARALASLLGVDGGVVCEEAAGTGGMLLAAVQSMRSRGLDPAEAVWVANDADPIAAGCLAVNTHLWGLPQVLIGCGDAIANDWLDAAQWERAEAIKKAATTPMSMLLSGGAS